VCVNTSVIDNAGSVANHFQQPRFKANFNDLPSIDKAVNKKAVSVRRRQVEASPGQLPGRVR